MKAAWRHTGGDQVIFKFKIERVAPVSKTVVFGILGP